MAESINLAQYLSSEIKRIVLEALSASFKNPKESAFLIKYLKEAKLAEKKRTNYEKKGRHIPAFLIASITSGCNLQCKGCYARANNPCGDNLKQQELTCEKWRDIFSQAQELGVAFILLAGGEPLLRKEVIECAARFKSIIFPVFTNGTMIGEEYLALFDKNRNLAPVISIEGDREQTDSRRGEGIYEKLTDVMADFKRRGIFYGASITVTTDNIATVTSAGFIRQLYDNSCKIVFFVEYVPVLSCSEGLAPGDPEREILESRLTELREQYNDMLFLAFPGDEMDMGGCLAAGRGFFHINAYGGAEPCPFSPYSDISLKEHTLLDALNSGLFKKLNQSGMLLGEHKGACLLFEKENEVKKLLEE